MIERPRIDDYMSRDLITLTPEIEINHAMNILLDRRLSGAPVLDETSRLVGVLSKKDCLKAALHASYFQEWGGTVRDYMSQSVETLEAGTDIVEAANAFLASPFRRFPVMRNGKLVGQVSRAAILRALRDCWN